VSGPISRAFASLLVSFAVSSGSQAALMGYVAEGTDIYRTNFETGQQTRLDLHGIPSIVREFQAIDNSPTEYCLYAVGHWRHSLSFGNPLWRGLYRIDLSTGDVSAQGVFMSWSGHLSRSSWFPDIAYSPDGTGYAIVETILEMFVPDPRNPSLLGVTPIEQVHAQGARAVVGDFRAFAINGNSTGIVWEKISKMLYSIRLTDALATEIGYLDGDFDALDYGPYGTLYGWGDKTLYVINLKNLTATPLRSVEYGNEAFAIPEPATLSLLAFGSLSLIRRQRRRNSRPRGR